MSKMIATRTNTDVFDYKMEFSLVSDRGSEIIRPMLKK